MFVLHGTIMVKCCERLWMLILWFSHARKPLEYVDCAVKLGGHGKKESSCFFVACSC